MKRRKAAAVILVFMLEWMLLWTGPAGADPLTNPSELMSAVQPVLPDVFIHQVQWAKTAENTAIAVYYQDGCYGAAILLYDPAAGFTVNVRNDRLIRTGGGETVAFLDDHNEEYGIVYSRKESDETDYLLLGRNSEGVWMVQGLEYNRTDEASEAILINCHLAEDGKTAVISTLVDPRIEWPLDTDFALAGFDLDAAHGMCEKAAEVMKDAMQSGDWRDTGHGYRIHWDAMEQYDPVIPEPFDSRMDDDKTTLILAREEKDGLIREEWTFGWQESAWRLTAVRRTESDGLAHRDGTYTETEALTEITGDGIRTRKQLKDRDSGEVLLTLRDVTFPNVLDADSLCLKQIRFDTPPVNAEGYNWSRNYGAYADEALMPKLFEVFFPDYTYADGCLMEDWTLEFIGRKENGTLVLLCGADEEETGWVWTESTPLPEGTRFGDENFTDVVNMNAWNGGSSVYVRRFGKDRWGAGYVNCLDFYTGPDWVGMYGEEQDARFFGTHPWGDITTIDWTTLPPEGHDSGETAEARAARLSSYADRTGWATPARNDPAETTELLKDPGDEAPLLGCFFNGTPLCVLERGAEWTKVRIGHGEDAGVMTGWMRTEHLAFGDDTLKVSGETISILSRKELVHPAEPLIGSRAGKITGFSGCLIIGILNTDQEYAIVYKLDDGDVGLIPTAHLWEGNG